MPKISIDEAKKLAKLSRLEFSQEELQKFTSEFDSILNYVDLINKVNTQNVDLKEKAIDAEEDLRTDVIIKSLSQDEIIANAPLSEDGAFVVPTTVEEGGQ